MADVGENWKTQVFTFWENLKNRRQVWAPPPQGANLPLARAAHEKHSGVPRRFRWSMGAVWYRQNDFYGPHARGGGFGHQGGGPRAWRQFLRFSQKTRKPRFPQHPPKSSPRCTCGPPLFRCPWSFSRETRETKRTTALQLQQLEGRGAFCFAGLARKAPWASEEGRPACTAGGGLWRILGKTGKPGFSGFGETVPEGSGFGLGEHRVGCLGW